MTQLNPNAFLLIEDRLDAIGQRYRVLQLLRGILLFSGASIIASTLLALIAHLIGVTTGGQSRWLWLLVAIWAAWLTSTLIRWIIKPLILRPKSIDMARLVESRVTGLHNTLTNSLLLNSAKDLSSNPYLPAILEENLRNVQNRPLDEAVNFSDIKRLTMAVTCIVALFLALIAIPSIRATLTHGWQQMFNPTVFVPVISETQILEVQPGDITLVTGQPLEVTILAKSSDAKSVPPARLIFDNHTSPIDLTGNSASDGQLRYAYRVEHIDASLKYRVEVGGTQSKWFSVTIVKQVKLDQLTLTVTPPLYTRQPTQNLTLKPDEIAKQSITLPQGSKIEIIATLDVPVASAMLQIGNATPVVMETHEGGKRFVGSVYLMEDSRLALLLTQGAGQIIARLPEQPLTLHVTRDATPIIEMKWPTQDTAIAPDAEIKIHALLKDDYGITSAKVLLATSPDQQLVPVEEFTFSDTTSPKDLLSTLKLKPEIRKHGNSIRVQIEATDNRDLRALFQTKSTPNSQSPSEEGGPQTVTSSIYEIKFRDPEQIKKEEKDKTDKLREALLEMLKNQNALLSTAVGWKPKDLSTIARINTGQTDLRARMAQVAQTFSFEPETKIIQKTLLVLYQNPAREAVELSAAISTEKVEKESQKLAQSLMGKQRRIISTLESLLAFLNKVPEVAVQPTLKNGGDIPGQKEALEKLNEALKQYIKEEQRILDQTAQLAKKPVDKYDDADKKLLEDLLMAQEKMDAFMQAKVNDVSKLAEQDMSNAALLKQLMEVYSEVTMAKNALKDKATEIAVSAEEMGQELAKELSNNIEKWLSDKPDRQAWKQEDPLTKSDIPMAELPKELEDMVGELMEEQEDLFDEMEDMDANWADSGDKAIGWDAADGPIANMSAKGVTGNQQPNDNNMNGRSGEGRSGKSQGEMVEDTASGKGGRPTPTRLDPTPFAKGQIKDESKDPTGGATGGGKLSGQGGQGLEGPVGPKQKEEMKRLADKQAQLRNQAERLNLQYQLGRYDNFQLLQAIAMMRRTESDLKANRYQMAIRRKDMTLDTLDTSHLLLGGQIHVKQDTTPTTSTKMEEQINDAMKGDLPAAWSDALKEYYKKLSME
jgi:hypothetical protein